MARSTFPQEAQTAFSGGANKVIVVYADRAATTLADIQTTGGATISGSVLTLDANGYVPQFLGPNPGTEVFARPQGSSGRDGETTRLTPVRTAQSFAVTGSRGGNAALASLLSLLAARGIITDGTTA